MTEETVNAVIVDERTGEEIPKGANELNTLQVQLNINLVGTLDLDDKAEEVLGQPLKAEEVRIRPDGLVYLPWTWYAERLNSSFGRLKWGLVPQGSPQSRNTGDNNVLVVWGFWLVIKGVPVGFAYGETSYRTDNSTMSYADAIEGAKSISLARNCKVLGMALELWDSEWVENWKKTFAETYQGKNNRTYWRKKSAKSSQNAQNSPQKPSGATESENGAVAQAEELSGGFLPKDLKLAENVIAIKDASGKPIPEVMKVLNELDKSTKYTVGQVVKILAGGENEAAK